MDFNDSPVDLAFRAELRSWLDDAIPTLGPSPETLEGKLPWWQAWQKKLYAAGYAGMAWPKEAGGRGASIIQQVIFSEECDRAGAPDRLNNLGEGLVGPTLIDFGSDKQRKDLLPPLLRGEHVWCQLFSEPNAGSDLAALQTKAVRDGAGWRISGQKVWSSRAQIASYGILLARTTPGSRHHGITFLLLDMKKEGVKVRPLRHMLGGSEFCEVFFDQVWVSDDMVVGAVDEGWKVAMATLGYERVALATGRVNIPKTMNDLIELVRRTSDRGGAPLGRDPVVRQRMAELYSRAALQRLTGKRILSGMENNNTPGPEASTAKLFMTSLVEDLADYALSVIGMAGQREPTDEAVGAAWLRLAYQARGTSIAGGSTFIQRNIVSERALGLPRK